MTAKGFGSRRTDYKDSHTHAHAHTHTHTHTHTSLLKPHPSAKIPKRHISSFSSHKSLRAYTHTRLCKCAHFHALAHVTTNLVMETRIAMLMSLICVVGVFMLTYEEPRKGVKDISGPTTAAAATHSEKDYDNIKNMSGGAAAVVSEEAISDDSTASPLASTVPPIAVTTRRIRSTTTTTSSSSVPTTTPLVYGDNAAYLAALRARMAPRHLVRRHGRYLSTQFMHLHHMKTGGTSLTRLINCARKRLDKLRGGVSVPSVDISECQPDRYARCVAETDVPCAVALATGAVATICAPLWQADRWGLDSASAVTVLRDPVDRVWSMYRFKTKQCYGCLSLLDVYSAMENGTAASLLPPQATSPGSVCLPQLSDHQTRNLLAFSGNSLLADEEESTGGGGAGAGAGGGEKAIGSISSDADAAAGVDGAGSHAKDAVVAAAAAPKLASKRMKKKKFNKLNVDTIEKQLSPAKRLAYAKQSLRERFAVIGLTNELALTRSIIGSVFPWLNETYSLPTKKSGKNTNNLKGGNGNRATNGVNNTAAQAAAAATTGKCILPHANSSPRNNMCGADGLSHKPLPDKPDEATRAAILRHNQLDLELFAAAQQHFRLQQLALAT